MVKHIPYPSINASKHLHKTLRKSAGREFVGLTEDKQPIFKENDVTVIVQGTVKIHGTNGGVALWPNGELVAQSRTRMLSVKEDNQGFCAYVLSQEEAFRNWLNRMPRKEHEVVIAFGEWCGSGIQKSPAAINKIDEKIFVVFNIMVVDPDNLADRKYYVSTIDCEHEVDQMRFISQYGVWTYVLNVNDNWNEFMEFAEKSMHSVENLCPVAAAHGVDGIGEGIVWKVINNGDCMSYYDSGFWFKLKGEKHSGSGNEPKIKVDVPPEVKEAIEAYVKLTLTEGRLEQGLHYLTENNLPHDRTSTGAYLKWITQDIVKEHTEDLGELNWKQVVGQISNNARAWFFTRTDFVDEAA